MKKMKSPSGRDICTFMFIAELFIIAKTWEQPKCPTMDKSIKKFEIYIYNYISVPMPIIY